jgi:hypothetical protein
LGVDFVAAFAFEAVLFEVEVLWLAFDIVELPAVEFELVEFELLGIAGVEAGVDIVLTADVLLFMLVFVLLALPLLALSPPQAAPIARTAESAITFFIIVLRLLSISKYRPASRASCLELFLFRGKR